MATTTFVNGTVIEPSWLNDVDAMVYDQTVSVPWKTITWSNATVTHSGAHTWSGNQIYNGSTTFNGTLAGNIVSGTYTPTLTNGANVAASTANLAMYIRVGNIVMVSGNLEIDPTAATTTTTINISLPIASNLAGGEDLSGTAVRRSTSLVDLTASVIGVSSDTASLSFVNDADVANRGWTYTFMYRII